MSQMIVPAEWTLPDSLLARLGTRTVGRQRAIIEQGHLLLVLHKPPGPDDGHRDGAVFWRDPHGRWSCTDAMLREHVGLYTELEGRLTDLYDDAKSTSSLFALLEQLTPLSRAARNMHHALQAARDAVGTDPLLIELRDHASDADRNFELLIEDVRNALQYRSAKDAEIQAKLQAEALNASHRLNILAALFFPLTAVGTIFGMNFVLGVETNASMFWVVVAIGVLAGVGTAFWVIGKR